MNTSQDENASRSFPPWLDAALAGLVKLVRSRQIPSGLLVTGPDGVGKGLLVRTFLQRIACTDAGARDLPCGRCNGCRSFLGSSHPEILVVQPAESGKDILVDDIRAVIDFLSLSHGGPARLVFIEPAEAMNANAANALLKTLEEPPAGAMLLLSAARPARLPATIRSRCRVLRIPTPDHATVRAWLAPVARSEVGVDEALAASLNRPLDARALLEDPDARAAWQVDRAALDTLLTDPSPFAAVKRFVDADLGSLLPRLQRLLLSAQIYLMTGRVDGFAQLFRAAAFEAFARGRGVREITLLCEESLQWHRDLRAALNPELRCEHIVLRFWRRGG